MAIEGYTRMSASKPATTRFKRPAGAVKKKQQQQDTSSCDRFTNNKNKKNRIVCKFWLAGNCSRKNCRFAHEIVQPGSYTYQRIPKPQFGNAAAPSKSVIDPQKPPSESIHNHQKQLPKQLLDNPPPSESVIDPQKPPSESIHNHQKQLPTQQLDNAAPSESVIDPQKPPSESINNRQKQLPKQLLNNPAPSKSFDYPQKPPSESINNHKEQPSYNNHQLCADWAVGNCARGDSCDFVHSWYIGTDFCPVATLKGRKGITGITIPTDSDKLYSSSSDGTLSVWDCHTGECLHVINFIEEIGSLISEGPWVFAGLPNLVKAGTVHHQYDLPGPIGQVHAMAVYDDMLIAGAEDGAIYIWKIPKESEPFQEIASLRGHSLPVVSLVVASNLLYSGSNDHTIRIWNLETLQWVQTLHGHSDAVTSVICWDSFLLSGSLDKTIKIWAKTEVGGSVEVCYTHQEKHGVLKLFGMFDSDTKPILYCSRSDNSVCLYELSSFTVRGKIFSRQEFRAISWGPGGLFFTGDEDGLLSVWRWPEKSQDADIDE